MIALDISTTSLTTLRIKKNYFGKWIIDRAEKIEIEPQERWEQKLPSFVKGNEVVFTIPDSETFLHRFDIPFENSKAVASDAVLSKASEFIPVALNDLVYDFSVVKEGNSSQPYEILFISTLHSTLERYQKQLLEITAKPMYAIPTSYAVFQVIKGEIKPDKKILYLSIERGGTSLIFFDQYGPLLSLSARGDAKELVEEVKKSILFFQRKYAKNIDAIILGDAVSEMKPETLTNACSVPTQTADTALQNILTRWEIEFEHGTSPKILFLNALGAGLITLEKNALNLMNSKHVYSPSVTSKAVEAPKIEETPISPHYLSPHLIKILLLIVWIIGISAILINYIVKKSNTRPSQSTSAQNIKKVVTTITPSIILTPTPTLKREDLTVQVLNGSGIRGAAENASLFLEGKGYENITTGNAPGFSYETTTIQIKEEKKAYLDLLLKDLAQRYKISTTSAYLDKESKFDIIIIVGET